MDQSITPVIVTLTSYARDERGEKENPIQLMCRGRLKKVSSGYLLRYVEVQTDDQTGESVAQEVMLQLQPGRVSMTRMGEFGTTMVFVKDRRFEGVYHTPYGDLAMALFAVQVQTALHDDHGYIHLEYQLDMQGGYAPMQFIDISYCLEGPRVC